MKSQNNTIFIHGSTSTISSRPPLIKEGFTSIAAKKSSRPRTGLSSNFYVRQDLDELCSNSTCKGFDTTEPETSALLSKKNLSRKSKASHQTSKSEGYYKKHFPLRSFVRRSSDSRSVLLEKQGVINSAGNSSPYVSQSENGTIISEKESKYKYDKMHKSPKSSPKNDTENTSSSKYLTEYSSPELKVSSATPHKLVSPIAIQLQGNCRRVRSVTSIKKSTVSRRTELPSSTQFPSTYSSLTHTPVVPPNSRSSKRLPSSAASGRTEGSYYQKRTQRHRSGSRGPRITSRGLKAESGISFSTGNTRSQGSSQVQYENHFCNENVRLMPKDLVDEILDVRKRNVLGVPIFEGYSFYSADMPESSKSTSRSCFGGYNTPTRKLMNPRSDKYVSNTMYRSLQSHKVIEELPQFTKFKSLSGSVTSFVTETLPNVSARDIHSVRPIFEIPDGVPARFAANAIIIRKMKAVFGKSPEREDPLLLAHFNLNKKEEISIVRPASIYKIGLSTVRGFSYSDDFLDEPTQKKQVSWRTNLPKTS